MAEFRVIYNSLGEGKHDTISEGAPVPDGYQVQFTGSLEECQKYKWATGMEKRETTVGLEKREITVEDLLNQYKAGKRVFSFASLSGADLNGANLSKADLRGADLRGADLRGVDLLEVDLSEAINAGYAYY